MGESDFSVLKTMYPGGVEPDADMKQGPSGAPDPMEGLGEFGANLAAADAQTKPAFQLPPGVKSMTIDHTGGMTFKGVDPRVFESLMDKSKKLDAITGAFHTTATQLQGREENAHTGWGAVGNVASRLAGNLAAQPGMPGWVRGLGETARELNPTPDELMHRRLGVQQQEAQATEQSMRLLEARTRAEDVNARYKAETERKAEADNERARGKELEVARALIKDSKGNVDAARFKSFSHLDDDDVELMKSAAEGEKKAESERVAARKSIVDSQNKVKSDIAATRASAVKALGGAKYSSPEAKMKTYATLQTSITRIEERLANDEVKIQANIWSKPEEKEQFVQKYAAARKELDVLKKLAGQMAAMVDQPAVTANEDLVGKMRAAAPGAKPAPAKPKTDEDALRALGVVSIR